MPPVGSTDDAGERLRITQLASALRVIPPHAVHSSRENDNRSGVRLLGYSGVEIKFFASMRILCCARRTMFKQRTLLFLAPHRLASSLVLDEVVYRWSEILNK